MPDQRPPDAREMGIYFTLAQVGVEMVTPLVVGLVIDNYLGTMPWLTLIGIVLGFVGGIAHIILLTNKQEAEKRERDARERAALIRRLLLLVAGSLLPLLLLAPLALQQWWIDDGHLLYSTVAAFLCLVPAIATLLWSELALGKSPEQQLAAVLGSTALRMAFVVGAALALYFTMHEFGREIGSVRFWLWIVGFYLWTLTVETVLVARRQ